MDEHQIEVGHRCLDDDRDAVVGFEAVHQFVHEVLNGVDVGAFVDDVAGFVIAHVDRTGAPAAWAVLQVVVGHHEVQALDELPLEVKTRLFGELQDVRHRVAVTLDRQSGLRARIESLRAHLDGYRVVEFGFVPLDAVRPLDCPRELHATQRSRPAPWLMQPGPQALAEALELADDLRLPRIKPRWLKQHDAYLPAKPQYDRL